MNIVENIIEAISILNKTEEYMNTLDDELSVIDQRNSDYQHLIENENLNEVNLEKLFNDMKEAYQRRRKIKQDKTIAQFFYSNSGKLNMTANREIFAQGIKNAEKNLRTDYKNRILTEEEIKELTTIKRKVGRPKKVVE